MIENFTIGLPLGLPIDCSDGHPHLTHDLVADEEDGKASDAIRLKKKISSDHICLANDSKLQ